MQGWRENQWTAIGLKGTSSVHYSDSTNNGTGFLAAKASGRGSWECATATPTLYAGYPHIHLWGNPEFARNFVQHCCEFAAQL